MKCHSCRSESETGAAWKAGEGLGAEEESSAVSRRRRRIVGDGAMRGYSREGWWSSTRESCAERKTEEVSQMLCEGRLMYFGGMRRVTKDSVEARNA